MDLGQWKLRYSTVQPMFCVTAGRQDIAVFAGPRGEMAQVVLDCALEPTTTRRDPDPAWVYDRGLLRVTAPLGAGGLTRVKVEGGGHDRSLLLLLSTTRPRYGCSPATPRRARCWCTDRRWCGT
ncbi:hypothetical protein SALBM311S_01719 [Streptomyces alboniger]